ncbi:hypothetical protein [Streptomyces lavendulae]|uniref:hypothetical protein n=1 Tax=Streptomyces lavendulae TaxID=1914 RepID=UPI00255496CC|nr:hypothetical protein [Streptomyces lavendulae]
MRATRISAWLSVGSTRGPEIPKEPRYVRFILLLIAHLEELARQRGPGHRRRSSHAWERMLREAQEERFNRGGRPPGRRAAGTPAAPVPDFVLPGPHADLVRQHFGTPDGLQDRQADLASLTGFVTDRRPGAPAYLYLQGGPYAGKSALLARFVQHDRPADVDVVGYFIATRLGNNRHEPFLDSVAGQLATVAGRKAPNGRAPVTRDLFHELCRAAAEASETRGRVLLLVVDGLDEDEGARPGGRSIAGCLPPVPPPNLRVLVSGRPNPPAPGDVPPGHPLTLPATRRVLRPWPGAHTSQAVATRELLGLLDDRPVGMGIVGLIITARGDLSARDLAALLGVLPLDVNERLRSLKGRSLTFDRTAPETARTYALGHKVFHDAAVEEIGDLTPYARRLHDWADDYRGRGWPADTPSYLLHHYTAALLHSPGTADRLAAFALDPRRRHRLLAGAAMDIALADLDRAARATPGSAPADLEVLAAVAASRELVSAGSRPLPRSVLRAFVGLGDTRRARGLALASRYPQTKASALADVARALAAAGDPDAPAVALEARAWALDALMKSHPADGGEEMCERAAAEAAVALVESGQGKEAMRLLTRGGCNPFDFITAATSCPPQDAVLRGELLDEAESRTGLTPIGALPVPGVTRLEASALIARVAPDRAERMYERIARQMRSSEARAEQLAIAASALATARPAEASAFAERARAGVAAMLREDEGVPDDGWFPYVLERVVRALRDTGNEHLAERLLEDVPPELLAGPVDTGFDLADDADHDDPAVEALAHEALALAERGRGPEARQLLDEALHQHARGGDPGGSGRVRWPVFLAGALAAARPVEAGGDEPGQPMGRRTYRVGDDLDADVRALASALRNPVERTTSYAFASLVRSATGRPGSAARLARAAASAARALPVSVGAGDARALTARALAHTGDGRGAAEMLERAVTPAERFLLAQAPYRRRRLAVLAGLGTHLPNEVGRRIDAERERLTARAAALGPGRADLLPWLGELLTAAPASVPGCRERLLRAVRETDPPMSEPPSRWRPDNDLTLALLEADRTTDRRAAVLDRLDRAQRFAERVNPDLAAFAGFALVRAALGDLDGAREAVDRMVPSLRAEACAVVAGLLAGLPAHLPTGGAEPPRYPYLPVLRSLAEAAVPGAAPGPAGIRAARAFARDVLTADHGWYHALPVLALLAPGAVLRVRDLFLDHGSGADEEGFSG